MRVAFWATIVRYGYRVTDSWGIEFSVGQSNNAVTDVPGGDIDLALVDTLEDSVGTVEPTVAVGLKF